MFVPNPSTYKKIIFLKETILVETEIALIELINIEANAVFYQIITPDLMLYISTFIRMM